MPKHHVCVVDNDPAFRETFRQAAKAAGFNTVEFGTAPEFLAKFVSPSFCCLLLNVQLPGMSGLELLEVLRARRMPIPCIILTRHGDVQAAIQAMKKGAVDCLEKPLKPDQVTDRLHEARDLFLHWQKVEQERQKIAARLSKLTSRELEVFQLMADGMKNTAIAKHLGISRKTLDIHRSKVVAKLKARTSADLARWRMLHESELGGTVSIKPGSYLP
jgi:FixJ family two-component response regulator